MVRSKKMSPEVLIYIQTLKKYLSKNIEAQKYFALENNEEMFYKYLGEISEQNFQENGEPELSAFQFEDIRRKLEGDSSPDGVNEAIGVFISFGNLGYMSLN